VENITLNFMVNECLRAPLFDKLHPKLDQRLWWGLRAEEIGRILAGIFDQWREKMNTRKFALTMGSALLLGSITVTATPALADENSAIATAVSATDRPESDRKLDESRKPAELLTFMGLKAGDSALDILSASGYYARIMGSVVGADGKVVAVNPPSFSSSEKALRNWADLVSRPDNILLSLQDINDFKAKDAAYDFAMLHLVYHDVYWESKKFGFPRADPDIFLTSLYKAMKPGGIVAVVDHVGESEDTRALVEAMHRINPAVVKADFAKAGFILKAESNMFTNPDDDHSKLVFDPAVRGKTDRFTFKFRKPD